MLCEFEGLALWGTGKDLQLDQTLESTQQGQESETPGQGGRKTKMLVGLREKGVNPTS